MTRAGTPMYRATSSATIRRLPSAIAPSATSSTPGTPNFLATNTPRVAPIASAAARATGIPPRAKPSTTTSGRPAYELSACASTLPASYRLRNGGRVVTAGEVIGRDVGERGTRLRLIKRNDTPEQDTHSLTATLLFRPPRRATASRASRTHGCSSASAVRHASATKA